MKSHFFAIHVNKHALRHCGLDPQSAYIYGIAGQARNDDVGVLSGKNTFQSGLNSKILFGVVKFV